MTHVMLDIETLGTTPDSVILTIGAVKFKPYDTIGNFSDEFYLRLDVDQQINDGRFVDEDTIAWWQSQNEDTFEEAFSETGRIDVRDAMTELQKFLSGVDELWANGVCFDMGILENLYRSHNTPVPWKFWMVRDYRTILSVLPQDVYKEIKQNSKSGLHNALQDAKNQAIGAQIVLTRFRNQNALSDRMKKSMPKKPI